MILHEWQMGLRNGKLVIWWSCTNGGRAYSVDVEIRSCNEYIIELWDKDLSCALLCKREHCMGDFNRTVAYLVGFAL